MNRKIVITGNSVLTPLGKNIKENMINLQNKKHNFQPIEKVIQNYLELYPKDCYISSIDDKLIENSIQKNYLVPTRAFNFANYCFKELLKNSNIDEQYIIQNQERIGISIGTLSSNLTFLTQQNNSRKSIHRMTMINRQFKIQGPSISPATACATSLSAIGDAYNLIKLNYADMMIVGGVEEQQNYLTFQGTKKMKVMYKKEQNLKDVFSCPFDKNRRGIILGEGCGFLILESQQNAIKRGANIIAEVIGYGMSCDGYDMVQPDPLGNGGFRAMKQAIDFSNQQNNINHDNLVINCHATSTQMGDKAEIKGLQQLYQYLNLKGDIKVTAFKGNYGHMFSASGIVETIMALNMCYKDQLYPICNLEESDIDIQGINLVKEQQNFQTKYLLKNSFGFGGLVNITYNQLVYTHLAGSKNYDKNTQQDNYGLNLGDDFQQTKQFSLWGWFKPEMQNPSISNILILQNLLGSDSYILSSIKNYPNCPFTKERLDLDESLRNLPQVLDNPSCDYENLQTGRTEDLLYVNYELQPPTFDTNQQYYNLGFLLARGFNKDINNSEIKLEGFENIPRTDEWTFFAFSADYQNGNVYIYVQTASQQYTDFKNFNIDYPNFSLKKNARLVIASQQQNDYFITQSGFIGQIANIEISRFYTTQLSYQWAGYIPINYRGAKSVIIDFVYDVYKQDKIILLQSYGSINTRYQQQGNYQLLNDLDPDYVGIRYFQNSNLSLGNDISFNTEDRNINSATFYFDLMPSKTFPGKFVLLTRGEIDQNGYLEISIINNGDKKHLRTIITGQNRTEIIDQQTDLVNNVRNQILIGYAQAPDNTLQYLYADSNNSYTWEPLIFNFPFDMGKQKIIMFNPVQNAQVSGSSGYVDMFRFMILNSASPIINTFNKNLANVQNIIQDRNNNQDKLCQYRIDVYQNESCIRCKDSIVDQNYQCIPYCPQGYKNQMNNICIQCQNPNCSELIRTTFTLKGVDKNQFEIMPTRPILNGPILYDQFQVVTPQNSDMQLDYNIQALENQRALVNVDVNSKNEEEIFAVLPYENPNNRYVDINRNLLLANGVQIEGTQLGRLKNLNNNYVYDENNYDCFVPSNRLRKMRVLAYILLLSYAGVTFILLVMTFVVYNKFWELGALWKFLLHHWMKLNLVAFFVLLAIIMPCCVREFLHQLYRFVVSWDHELRHWINDANEGSTDYQEAFVKRQVPYQFRIEHVRPFILHNLLISFIVQLAIAFIYIVLKLWDMFQTSGKSFLFRILVFWEFTALIVGYLLFHMRDFVFSTFNWRKAIFSHSYFVCCFLIALAYIIIFIVFWAYTLWRLLFGGTNYWSDPINVNKYYFFRFGYRNSQLARTYDHWVTLAHFIVGIMIGLLIQQALAQMIVIVSVLVLLFAATIVLRPWQNIILLISDLISQVAILVTVIFFLVFAILDEGSCKLCGDRDNGACWVIILFLFICFMLSLLGLLAAAFMDCLRKDQKETIIEREDIYHEDRQFINEYGSQRVVYPVAQDMLEDESRSMNYTSYNYGNKYSVNNYNTRSVNAENFDTITVNEVKGVQPDDADDSLQNEIFGLVNDQSLGYKQSYNTLTDYSRTLTEHRNQFYNTLNGESKVISNYRYQQNSDFD